MRWEKTQDRIETNAMASVVHQAANMNYLVDISNIHSSVEDPQAKTADHHPISVAAECDMSID